MFQIGGVTEKNKVYTFVVEGGDLLGEVVSECSEYPWCAHVPHPQPHVRNVVVGAVLTPEGVIITCCGGGSVVHCCVI